MGLSESDTRAKLIDPALHARGWTEDLIRREETAGAIEIVDGRPRKQRKGRIDYLLRIKVNPSAQPVAVALIEAKAEDLPPAHGLEQGKLYAASRRLNVPLVFSSNGHLFFSLRERVLEGTGRRCKRLNEKDHTGPDRNSDFSCSAAQRAGAGRGDA